MHRTPLSFNYYSCQDQVSLTWPLSPFYSNTSWPARFELLQADITKEKMAEHTNHKRPQGPVYLLGPCLVARCKLCGCEYSSTCGTCELTRLLLRFSPHLHLQATGHILLLTSAHSNLQHLYAMSTISVMPHYETVYSLLKAAVYTYCLLYAVLTPFWAWYISEIACTSLGFSCNFRIAVSRCDTMAPISSSCGTAQCISSWHNPYLKWIGGGGSPQTATFAYITHLRDQRAGEHLVHGIHCHYVFRHLRCHRGSCGLFFLGWNWHPLILWNNTVVFPVAHLQISQSQSYPNFYQK